MSPTTLILGMVSMAATTVIGDWFLKVASQSRESPFGNKGFVIGVILYAVCAFGWVYVMQHMKLSTIGVVYSVSTVLMLTALGVLRFGETLTRGEWAGIGCAVLSVVLLSRHGA
jgi:undecaprenyl phosphate-alpha-L-ara4N flippase subunit ArnF